MKSTWKIINEEKGKTKIIIQSLVINNNVIMNQNKIANIFNNYFISIADTLNLHNNKYINTSVTNPINCLTNNLNDPFQKSVGSMPLLTYKIEKIIKSLKSRNTCGCEEICDRIIKLTAPFIIATLTHLKCSS